MRRRGAADLGEDHVEVAVEVGGGCAAADLGTGEIADVAGGSWRKRVVARDAGLCAGPGFHQSWAGWRYDGAGNVGGTGSSSYTYDPVSRVSAARDRRSEIVAGFAPGHSAKKSG